ncbi:hypothetical protein JCM3770_005620 [Rhodotorula araucariae]
MLDGLPDELVLAILAHLSQPGVARWDYLERQEALCALCLTARRYRSLAQPLLWQQARIDSARDIALVLAPEVAALRRNLRFLGVTHGHTHWLAILALLAPNLEELSSLRRLSIEGFVLFDSDPTVPFPRLRELRLERVRVEPSVIRSWLDAQRLPHLRVLFFDRLHASERSHPYFPSASEALLAQLDFIQTRVVDRPTSLRSPSAPPLAVEVVSILDLPHHALLQPTFHRNVTVPELVHYITVAGNAVRAQGHLSVAHFVRHAAEHWPDLGAAVDELGAACTQANRRLRWWDGVPVEGELVSHEFWPFARELKAARPTTG